MAELRLFNSLTRTIEPFRPIHADEARVYTCGPTVYADQHIGNMRAYVFADTLGRTLSHFGYRLTHVINITDVGHLTSDADAGADKMEAAAARTGGDAWAIARHYTEAYWRDIDRLNIRQPAHWTIATDFVPKMIEWAQAIEADHCYRLPSGLYFDVSTVPDYGRMAPSFGSEGHHRVDPVAGKRNPADFAIWRTTPVGETRQMEWDSPWGRGAPGWHLECSVMSAATLGHPFDIHTGGIDHREIHHPNEIAQNQAHAGCDGAVGTGATIWMHNNFLVDRRGGSAGKMSKSSGEFLTLQALVDRGFHPLSYRLMCLQAHYRSEMEFTWEGLAAAQTRLKRLAMAVEKARKPSLRDRPGVEQVEAAASRRWFDEAISADLNTPEALAALEDVLDGIQPHDHRLDAVRRYDPVLGLDLLTLTRADLRVRPASATVTDAEVEARLAERREARAARDFARSDAIRDELGAAGVDVMDGDPLGWDWRPVL